MAQPPAPAHVEIPINPDAPVAAPAPAVPVADEDGEPIGCGLWGKWKWRVTKKTWWHWTYLLDYVLCLTMFFTGLFLVTYVIEPYHRHLPEGDPEVTYPKHSESIPVWLLMIISVFVPILAFAVYQFWGRSLHDFHHATLGVLEGVAFVVLFTQLLKDYTGKYRPNYLARNNDDGRQSFPSGHASISMQSGVFLSLWLAGKLGIMKKTGGHVWQQAIVFIPIIGAVLIAFSRTRDYYHDFVDSVGGIVLGASLGIFNYFLKYPPLWKRNCEIPKRRWYQPHKNRQEWANRYAAAEANVPPGQQL